MFRFDPPYPSFAFVMTKAFANNFDLSHLPLNRPSILERLAHAGLPASSSSQTDLMKTVDRRSEAQSVAEMPASAPIEKPCCEYKTAETRLPELDLPVVDSEYEVDDTREEKGPTGQKLADKLLAMLKTLKRRASQSIHFEQLL